MYLLVEITKYIKKLNKSQNLKINLNNKSIIFIQLTKLYNNTKFKF